MTKKVITFTLEAPSLDGVHAGMVRLFGFVRKMGAAMPIKIKVVSVVDEASDESEQAPCMKGEGCYAESFTTSTLASGEFDMLPACIPCTKRAQADEEARICRHDVDDNPPDQDDINALRAANACPTEFWCMECGKVTVPVDDTMCPSCEGRQNLESALEASIIAAGGTPVSLKFLDVSGDPT